MLIMSTIKREMAPSMKYFLYFFMKTLYIRFSFRIDEKNIVVTYSILFKKNQNLNFRHFSHFNRYFAALYISVKKNFTISLFFNLLNK